MKKYLVGGAVRDKLMGKTPKDRDWVIVGATDEDVQGLLAEGYEQVGADFPVFLHPETKEEYALARVERKTGVGYHGFTVQADSSVTIEEDLARRDLTINSMAMDEDGNVIDPYGGRRDLHNHVLRHTTESFAEDPLRVLRLARFAARLPEWTIAKSTIALCKQLNADGELDHLSIERIWVEMEKGFTEESPRRFMEVLVDTDSLKCKVLGDIFGQTPNPVAFEATRAIACVPKDQRLYVSVAVLGALTSTLPGAPARARDCHSNLLEVRASSGSAASLAQILRKSRAYQKGPSFMDLVMAVSVIERTGFSLKFTAKQLTTAQHIASEVRAADFPGVEGKALGELIEATRIQNLQMGLSIPVPTVEQMQG